ncbi:hypothetical protein EGM88_14965 [Aureibaculum marinum]|uniref:Uncharacterized protein n=1 Tax=Aureibaculum marinum TaxID=2487930 RepID=A0A3N4NCV0_9FLAO|nr:hypothetical protein [Aureibaculum marinum]RPD91236.1 hypothetical protein EGM88_14965 [Aureibaculum marinum]
MKKIMLVTICAISAFTLQAQTTQTENIDACAEQALSLLETYEYEIGEEVDDDTATDILNAMYAVCWCETSDIPDPNCPGL